jgi:trans-2,3-dihydro-3-hydroxyanthranilate isomerase
MTPYRFVLCDVFSDKPLAGQPLAVFTRATGLSDERMQALAREFNNSETAFVQPPAAGAHAKLRVFGPASEVLEPGHSVLGTAVVLGGALQAETVRLETQRGPVSVRLEREGARIVFAWIDEILPVVTAFRADHELAAALRLAPSQLQGSAPGCSAGHVVLGSNLEQLLRLAPDRRALAELGVERLCVLAGERGRYRARVFVPASDERESPVTPATAAAVAAYLVRHEREPADGNFSIEAGAELARPSLVHLRLDGPGRAPGAADGVAIGGAAVVVGRGEVVS